MTVLGCLGRGSESFCDQHWSSFAVTMTSIFWQNGFKEIKCQSFTGVTAKSSKCQRQPTNILKLWQNLSCEHQLIFVTMTVIWQRCWRWLWWGWQWNAVWVETMEIMLLALLILPTCAPRCLQSYHHPFHMCTVITMIRMITAVCGIRGSHKSKFLGGRVVRRCCPGFPQGKLRLCLGDRHLTKMGAPAKGKDCHLAMQAEMQKVADPADISVLFFSAGANFWAI